MSVFDASAVIAILLDEPGQDLASTHLEGAGMSLVNVAEVAGRLVQAGSHPLDALFAVNDLGLRWMQVDPAQAERVAELRRVKGLSLGDRFCIALAEALEEPVVTADRAWAKLSLSVPVELIR